MNSQRFLRYSLNLALTLNIVQLVFSGVVHARPPNVVDELEANIQFLEKQVPSFMVRSHEEFAQHWGFSVVRESFKKAKSEIETLSHKEIAVEQNQRFAERILVRYLGLQTRLALVYARVAHLRSGFESQFSFKKLESFNLRISKESAASFRVIKPHNVRHVDAVTLEIFMTSQDLQLTEFAALMNPKTEEEYLKVLQFSALRSGIVNRWALDQAYLGVPEEQLFYFPVKRFLSFADLTQKTISQTQAYQELNADVRLEGFMRLKPALQESIRAHSILDSVGLESALTERLLSLPEYFKKNQFNSSEDNLAAADEVIKGLRKKVLADWDSISSDVIETSSMVGDLMQEPKYHALIDRLLETSFGYLSNLTAYHLTYGMVKSGFIKAHPEKELEKNEKMLLQFKTEWMNALRPKLTELVKNQAQDSWKQTRKELHQEKMEFMRKSVLESIWVWNILLDTKNANASVIASIRQVPGQWKLVTMSSAEEAKHYFFRVYQPTGNPFVDTKHQEWAIEFFSRFEAQSPGKLGESELKRALKEYLAQYTSKSLEQFAKEWEEQKKNPVDPSVAQYKEQFKEDPRDEIKRVFHLNDQESKILRTVREYQSFAESKREHLLSQIGSLRLLRKDAIAMERLKQEHAKQVRTYDEFMRQARPYRERHDGRELFRPEIQDADDLLLSLVRAWKSDPNSLITDTFQSEVKQAFDNARVDATGKLEKFFMIHDLTRSKSNADHRLILQSTERVRQTFIQSGESFKKLDESLMKQTRSVTEKLDDMLENVVMFIFYAILVVGAATLVVASDGALAPLLQGLLSAGVVAINVLGVANVVTRTTVDFYVLPPQLEYQKDYANYLSATARQEAQQGSAPILKGRDSDRLSDLDQKGQTLDNAIDNIEEQVSDRRAGIVWSALDMTGVGEVIQPLKPLTKMSRNFKAKIIRYRRMNKI